jgi:hypothetical protein
MGNNVNCGKGGRGRPSERLPHAHVRRDGSECEYESAHPFSRLREGALSHLRFLHRSRCVHTVGCYGRVHADHSCRDVTRSPPARGARVQSRCAFAARSRTAACPPGCEASPKPILGAHYSLFADLKFPARSSREFLSQAPENQGKIGAEMVRERPFFGKFPAKFPATREFGSQRASIGFARPRRRRLQPCGA